MKTKKHAALYVRVSTDAQREEGYSIDAQKEALEAACKVQGITDYEFYVDGGFSGSNIQRPELERMLEDIKAGTVSHCFVYKLDRLSRSQKDTLYLIEDVFNKYGVNFVSLKETIDTATPMGKLMIGILSAFAQLERENIRERTQMGMLERVKEGYWMGGGRTPYGYDYDSEQGILVPNQNAENVREMYRLYLKGYAPQKIANMFGLKYDRLVIQILCRKCNIGIIEFKGKEYKGRHEALIDEQIYYETMLRMKARAAPHISSSDNLLTGLVYCGRCGAKMAYQPWGPKGKKFSCYSQQSSKKYLIKDENCKQPKVWADEIEEIVINDIFHFSLQHSVKNGQPNEGTSMLSRLSGQIQTKKTELKRLYDLYAQSGNEILLETIADKEKQIGLLQEQVLLQEKQEAAVKAKDAILDKVDHLSEIWDVLTQKEKKNIIYILVDRITIDGDKVEIRYKL